NPGVQPSPPAGCVAVAVAGGCVGVLAGFVAVASGVAVVEETVPVAETVRVLETVPVPEATVPLPAVPVVSGDALTPVEPPGIASAQRTTATLRTPAAAKQILEMRDMMMSFSSEGRG